MHDPTKFPNIYSSKKKAQQNFCSFRFKVSIHKVFHQHNYLNNELCYSHGKVHLVPKDFKGMFIWK